MDALGDHAEEIKNILDDIESDKAQRAAFDLLFGEEYEGEWADVCKDEIATNFSSFCTVRPNPTQADIEKFLRQRLQKRLKEV